MVAPHQVMTPKRAMIVRAKLRGNGVPTQAPLIRRESDVAVELRIEREAEGWLLMPMNDHREALWDQWYETIELAKNAAAAQFGQEKLDWEPVDE